MDKRNLAAIRQTFGCVVYTHKIHEVCAENETKKNLKISITNIVIVWLTLATLIIYLLNKEVIIWNYLGISLTVIEIIFLIIQLTFNFWDKSSQHKKTALSLLHIRDEYIWLIADIINETINGDQIIAKRELLQSKLNVIYNFALPTSRKAYQEAQKRLNPIGIVDWEDFTFTDKEIDRFLPKELHRVY